MTGWRQHTGRAVALELDNIDTDQLIPARFMSTPREEGYGRFLLHDLRHDADGAPRPDFPLNRHGDASVLIAGRNFGSGSSREAAVYALVDFGIRVVIAPSFGDIFAANAVNNGLLPAQVDAADARALIAAVEGGIAPTVTIDTRRIEAGDLRIAFHLGETQAQKLINGWDDIDLTQQHRAAIAAYRDRRAAALPWAFPAPDGAG